MSSTNTDSYSTVKKKVFALFIISVIFLFIATPAFAQDYSFKLDSEIVHVYWEEDGTLSLFYELNFSNDAFGVPIEYVDVGIPTSDYSIGNISGTINGQPIFHIAYSEYVSGIELGLESNSIPPGKAGQVTMQITGIGSVLYPDDDDETYASAVFSPNWFGSQYVHGSTDITIVFHLPPGVQPDEPRWHSAPSGFPSEPQTALDSSGRVTYSWRNASSDGYTQYNFGASFPKEYVPEDSIYTPPPFQIDYDALFGFGFFCLVGFLFLGIPILTIVGGRNRKMKYLPPKVAIEGHGIKRGLTAIEAAVLLEEPMDKILTMILFAVIKKDAAKVTKRDPLALEVITPLPDDLRKYEINFLAAFKEDKKSKRKKEMQTTMITLVKSITRKMKGFSRKKTRRYYRDIMRRAWEQVEAAATPEVMSEKYDEVMEWTMLDRDYEDRTRNIFTNRPIIVPTWWNRYDPGYGRTTVSRPVSSSPSKGGSVSVPS
ncbi:MAG: hypothetical protein N2C13_00805, partial [Chloroflexota bacterium]